MYNGKLLDTDSVKDGLDSLLSWWALAGVDCVVDEESIDWLHAAERRVAERHAHATPAAFAANAPAEAALPTTITAFHDYLATTDSLPEARWPGRRVLPSGQQDAPELMIILPAPDAENRMGRDDAADGTVPIVSAAAMTLLCTMVKTIGLTPDQCYFASLSIIAPPGGMIDSEIIPLLVERMTHHVSLVKPKAILLAGDQTNRALTPINANEEAHSSHFIRYNGGKVRSTAILHPRLMLEQPTAKAGAWKALRTLIGD